MNASGLFICLLYTFRPSLFDISILAVLKHSIMEASVTDLKLKFSECGNRQGLIFLY